MKNILDLDRNEIGKLIDAKPYRTSQIFQWVFQKRVKSIDEMTNLPLDLRRRLALDACISYPECVGRQLSSDGTEKLAYRLHDSHVIESVLIPDNDHWTVCVSSQVGCAMGCAFCYTARMGFVRSLSSGEILAQILYPMSIYPEKKITNIVFMGMGEPMLNLENVMKALDIISDPLGLKIAKRKTTVSTCGIIPGIKILGEKHPDVGLAVSLSAPTDELRSRIMPVNRKYPLEDLIAELKAYPLPKRKRITFEYVLLGGINDSTAHAKALITLLHGIKAKVNLIPFNPWPESSIRAPESSSVLAFEECLKKSDIMVTMRREKGQDILAACGQLAGGKVNERITTD